MTPHNADASVLLATSNLGGGRNLSGQRRDVLRLAAQGVRVIAFQEADGAVTLDGYKAFQGTRDNGTPAGEGILVHESLPTRRPRFERATEAGTGGPKHPISDRDHASVAVRLTGVGWTRVVSVHRPPRDYPAHIKEQSAEALRMLIKGRLRWLALGDFNQRHPQPTTVIPATGQRVAGNRIDLAYASPLVASRVVEAWEKQDPKRNDDHPVVYVRIN